MCVLFEDIFITLMLTSAGYTCGYAYVSSSRTLKLSMCTIFEDILITLMLTSVGCTCGYAYVSSPRTAELSMCTIFEDHETIECIIFEDHGAIDVSSSRTAELSMCPLRGLRSSFGEEHGNCLLRGSPRRGLMCITAGVNLRISQTLMASTSKMSHQMLSAFFENIQHF